ncbi:TetR/AcrR family transcriptional regulator C-terminal domain-containing protein [Nocardia cerradoensis]|uniref:TetR/AcrR family transcriptional regulator C-terminal domain-containing protein n=1 Tax=Nocardia cerradoensis TaxID=85688 RepID=UPI000316A425|nr:TetR/AcrR family transcriptional regulator C-terminal domain-containing protein [Nocardia cerradoensis]NKY42862.1 TetR family transcriptional regulator [Nocardia cerradoensis]
MADSGEAVVAAGRRRGRPPRLNRRRILAAARDLEPENLTMQAVADALGVHRKSLNYHVSDRQGLLELVAFDAFDTRFGRVDLPERADWRELLRLFGHAVVDALVQVGALIAYVRFDGKAGLSALRLVERTMAALVRAGLDTSEAGRTLKLVAAMAYSAAREALDAGGGPIDPQAAAVRRTLGNEPGFPLLRAVAAARETDGRVGEQFEFDLALIIEGLERRLEIRHGAGAPAAPGRAPGRP